MSHERWYLNFGLSLSLIFSRQQAVSTTLFLPTDPATSEPGYEAREWAKLIYHSTNLNLSEVELVSIALFRRSHDTDIN